MPLQIVTVTPPPTAAPSALIRPMLTNMGVTRTWRDSKVIDVIDAGSVGAKCLAGMARREGQQGADVRRRVCGSGGRTGSVQARYLHECREYRMRASSSSIWCSRSVLICRTLSQPFLLMTLSCALSLLTRGNGANRVGTVPTLRRSVF